MVEVEVPGLEILEQVRHVHVRSVLEVLAGAEVDVAERLEVGDLRRAEAGLLGGREAEEELRRLGDEIGAGDAGGHRHLLGQAPRAVEAAAGESFANARHAEHPVQLLEQRVRAVGDRVQRVGAEEHGDVVLLEHRLRRVAGEADGVLQRTHRLSGRGRSRACRSADARPPGRARTAGSTATPRPPSRRDRRAWPRSARRARATRPRARPAPPGGRRRARPCAAWRSPPGGGAAARPPRPRCPRRPTARRAGAAPGQEPSRCCAEATPPAGRRARRCPAAASAPAGRGPQQPSSSQSQGALKQSAGARRDPWSSGRGSRRPAGTSRAKRRAAKPCRGIRRAARRTARATRRCPGWPCIPWR